MAPSARPRDPFRSARLIYRAVRPEDKDFFAALNDDRIGYINSNATNIKLPSAEDAEKFMKSLSDDLLGAIICLAEEGSDKPGTAIGQIHLKAFPRRMQHHRNTEIGVDILPEYQCRGFGSEAINWALDYAFRKAGLHRVRIRAFGWNKGALRLYERLGFTLEGREREAWWHEGRFWDGLDFGMLDREWWTLQEKTPDI